MAALQADFLLSLAQRGIHRAGILGLGAATGKADLPGVVFEMRGTLGQQHGEALGARHQWHQHRRRRQRPLLGLQSGHSMIAAQLIAGRKRVLRMQAPANPLTQVRKR
jgi:hypothetical protein